MIFSLAPAILNTSDSWLEGWKYYSLGCRKQIPGQGKGLSEGVSSVCLIERCVVNCCAWEGRNQSVFSLPWLLRPGVRDWSWQTQTQTYAHAQLCQEPPKTMPYKHKLAHADPYPPSTGTHTAQRKRMCMRGYWVRVKSDPSIDRLLAERGVRNVRPAQVRGPRDWGDERQ